MNLKVTYILDSKDMTDEEFELQPDLEVTILKNELEEMIIEYLQNNHPLPKGNIIDRDNIYIKSY